jgi:hypothetical protein
MWRLLTFVLPAAFYGGFFAGRVTSTGVERLAALGVGVVGWYVLASLVPTTVRGAATVRRSRSRRGVLRFGALGMWIVGVMVGAMTGGSDRQRARYREQAALRGAGRSSRSRRLADGDAGGAAPPPLREVRSACAVAWVLT